MNGRIERDLEIENHIQKILVGREVLLHRYVDYQNGAPSTIRAYLFKIISFMDYLHKERNISCNPDDLKKVLPADINAYIKSLNYKHDTKGHITKTSTSYRAVVWSAINNFFKFLVENGYLQTNPCQSVKRISVKDPIPTHHLETNEIQALVKKYKMDSDKCDKSNSSFNRDYCITILLINTGIRASALIGINIDDIDWNNNTIKIIDKGEKVYNKFLNTTSISLLKNYLQERNGYKGHDKTDALFISQNGGKRLTYNMILYIVRKLTKEAGHEVSPHALRHTYGSLVYEKSGGDLNFTRQMLNHSNAQVTLRYINNDNSGKEKEIQKFMDDMME